MYHDRIVALVTGANRGIGLEVARQLAGRGMTVVFGARDLEEGRAVSEDLRAAGYRTGVVRVDVSESGNPATAIGEVAEKFGRLDVLVNNAGRTLDVEAIETSAEDLRTIFETNVFGAAEMIRASLSLLRRSNSARIVNVSSTTGSLTLTAAGTDFGGDASRRLAYSASKAALNMLTLQYHRAFQNDPSLCHIKINAATPGYTATDMTHHGAGARPVGDGARVIVELASLSDVGASGGFFNDQGSVVW